MRREIDSFVELCKERMQKRGWGVSELVENMPEGKTVHRATAYSLLKGEHNPSINTIVVIGETLGLEKADIDKGQNLILAIAHEKKEKRHQVAKEEFEGFDLIEQRLRKASNFLALAQKEMNSVDETIATALDEVSSRLRLVSTMKNGLKFVK